MTELRAIATGKLHLDGAAAGEGIEAHLQLLAADILRERKRRLRLFPSSCFAEVGWDILLFLYTRDIPTVLRTLADEVGAPAEMAERRVSYLQKHGLVTKDVGTSGRFYALVELTPKGSQSLALYLSECFRQRQRRHWRGAKAAQPLFSGRAVAALMASSALLSIALAYSLMTGYRLVGLSIALSLVLVIGSVALIAQWIVNALIEARG